MAEWKLIAEAFLDPKVTGEQHTLFVARFGEEKFPSFNCVYYDPLYVGNTPAERQTHCWVFADGGGAYHRDWPTHWMFAELAAEWPRG